MLQGVMIVLISGILFSKVFEKIKLPGLLGMIIAGILIGPYGLNCLNSKLLNISTEIRNLALIIILLRAGLGLNMQMLKKVGVVSAKMSMIPCIIEGAGITFAANKFLNLPIIEAGMLGFIIAAVSPAVVVPSMLKLKEKGFGMKKGIPIIILAGSSVDDVFAITLFTAFLGMGTNSGESIGIQLAKIPVEIIGGIVLGIILGFLFYKFVKIFKMSDMEQLLIFICLAIFAKVIGDKINIAGLLGVMTMAFVFREKSQNAAAKIESKLNKIWFFAQVFLFVLIGSAVNIQVAFKAGVTGLVVIAIGLIARSIGVMIALWGSNLNLKEKIFCAISYMPKATVQAAIGGIPLAAGVGSGSLILAIAVLAILFTAPLGLIGINVLGPKFLEVENSELENVV